MEKLFAIEIGDRKWTLFSKVGHKKSPVLIGENGLPYRLIVSTRSNPYFASRLRCHKLLADRGLGFELVNPSQNIDYASDSFNFYVLAETGGEENSFRNKEHLLLIANLMANCHNLWKEIKLPYKSLPKSYLSRGIENLYAKIPDIKEGFLLRDAVTSVGELRASAYEAQSKAGELKGCVSFGRFGSDAFKLKNGKMLVNDCSSLREDLPIFDLERLMRKALFYHEVDFVLKLVENYEKSRKITQDDLKILRGLLLFPTEFFGGYGNKNRQEYYEKKMKLISFLR